MGKQETYRTRLRELTDWDDYLLAECGLPGPRGNLELAQAVAEEGDGERFVRYLEWDAARAPVNDPHEFLAFCGAVGLGRLVAEGEDRWLTTLRACASDPRWRMREGVAMALQRLGDADMARLLEVARAWAEGNPLEQRAAAAAVCEPRLLRLPEHARACLDLLDRITAALVASPDRKSTELRVLRQGLGYCWSVAVAALPEEGKPMIERWLAVPDPDVRQIMRENLKKTRLTRLDPAWAARMSALAS